MFRGDRKHIQLQGVEEELATDPRLVGSGLHDVEAVANARKDFELHPVVGRRGDDGPVALIGESRCQQTYGKKEKNDLFHDCQIIGCKDSKKRIKGRDENYFEKTCKKIWFIK